MNISPKMKIFFFKYYKIIVLSAKKFIQNKCPIYASSLSLLSLLSVVPILAMVFAVAKGFGAQKILENQILSQVPQQEEILKKIILFAKNLLENTQENLIAGIGVLLLLFTSIRVLWQIEQAFNSIWRLKKERTIKKKFTDYFAIIIIFPILILISSSFTITLSGELLEITESLNMPIINDFLVFIFRLLPYPIIWSLFSFLFISMPNTKVNFKSGLIGGIATGTLYQISQVVFIYIQLKISSYNAIYGSFAALPLFIIWLRIGWSIILYGAGLSYIHQNFNKGIISEISPNLSVLQKNAIAIQVLSEIVKQFAYGKGYPSILDIRNMLGLRYVLVQDIINDLVSANLILEIEGKKEDLVFIPAIDTSILTLKDAMEKLEKLGENKRIYVPEKFENIIRSSKELLANEKTLIKDL